MASSVFVRHTLNALYTDLTVTIHKVHVRNGGGGDSLSAPSVTAAPNETPRSNPSHRERAITIGILVSGLSRLGLSAERAEWDV